MKLKVLDLFTQTFQADSELPIDTSWNFDQYLDYLIGRYRSNSEDLSEQKYFLGQQWLEIRDQDGFNNRILHFFNEEGAYKRVVNGKVFEGSWEQPSPNSNTIIIDVDDDDDNPDLYDLGFLGNYFFILSKHTASQYPVDQDYNSRYFVMGIEGAVSHLTWIEYAKLFNEIYRERSSFYSLIALVILLLIGLIVVLSL